MVAHNPEAGITRIKLPSGSKKVSQASSAQTHTTRRSMPLGCAFCKTLPCRVAKVFWRVGPWLSSHNACCCMSRPVGAIERRGCPRR